VAVALSVSEVRYWEMFRRVSHHLPSSNGAELLLFLAKNIMVKSVSSIAVFATLFVAFMIAFSTTASAASITNVAYSNNDVTVQGTAGQSVSGQVRVVVPNNEEVEFVEFDVISDALAPVCVAVNRLQEGTHFVNIPGDVKFPPNTGTYSLQVKTSGIFGGMAAIDCVNNVNGTQNFGSSVRTVGSGSTVGTGSNTMDSLMALIASLTAKVEALTKPAPAPSKPAFCEQATKHSVSMGMTGPAVTAYQWFLIQSGFSIPAGATGYFGGQTLSATMAMTAACR
jgi:hypothetical protein